MNKRRELFFSDIIKYLYEYTGDIKQTKSSTQILFAILDHSEFDDYLQEGEHVADSEITKISKDLSKKLNEKELETIKTSIDVSKNRKAMTDVERMVVARSVQSDETEIDKIVKKLVIELENALELFSDEDEEFSSAEKKIVEIEHEYNMRILGEVIQNVYINNFDNSSYMIGICRSLLRYDCDEVKPWGPILLAGILNHKDDRVKEYAVELIDNWNDKDLLPLLRGIQVTEQWLRDYINNVVRIMEKKDVLYQEII